MVPFRARPSHCLVLILSPVPSPSDASHASYCKHKRLTVIIMAIIRYEFTIQHFPFFSQRRIMNIITKRKSQRNNKMSYKKLRKNRYELLRISTTVSSCWDKLACSRFSDSGEDAKEKATRKVLPFYFRVCAFS